jgi:hypothetical protein
MVLVVLTFLSLLVVAVAPHIATPLTGLDLERSLADEHTIA